MTIAKPKHLGPEYGDQFKDRSVADAYVNYPPYPAEVFEVLESLIQDAPRIVLGRRVWNRRSCAALGGTCGASRRGGPVGGYD